MIELLKKILDAVMVVVGFVLGKKQSDIEHELSSAKDIKQKQDKLKKEYEKINQKYDKMVSDYNNIYIVPKKD